MRWLPALLILTACASKPPTVVQNIDCPQPAAATIATADKLPQVPELSTDASVTIGILADIVERDRVIYDNEVAKRETLVNHGVDRCKWSR